MSVSRESPSPDRCRTAGGPVVALRGVEKVFADGTHALAPIDLSLSEGEFVTLIGPSGCGKSTLLSLVAHLDLPSAGAMTWWDGDFDALGDAGHRLSVVFQDPTLMPWLGVASNVRLPLDLAGQARAAATARVAAALDRVGLAGQGGKYPHQLSGGMRMRVAIARGLVTEPDLLLMDEPFGALDEFTRNRLGSDLNALWNTRTLTVIFVTHSIYEAVFLSTRIVVMAAGPGRIVGELVIDEPQPRRDAFRTSPRFAALCRTLAGFLAEADFENESAVGWGA